jgi:hypothetical protein
MKVPGERAFKTNTATLDHKIRTFELSWDGVTRTGRVVRREQISGRAPRIILKEHSWIRRATDQYWAGRRQEVDD